MLRAPSAYRVLVPFVVALPVSLATLAGCAGNHEGAGGNSDNALTSGAEAKATSATQGPSASAGATADNKAKNANNGWSTSYQADVEGTGMGGTELRSLVGFNNNLYAGIGYWSDADGQASKGAPPGAQILVKTSASAPWSIEMDLDETLTTATFAGSPGQRKYFAIASLRSLVVTTDGSATPLQSPAHLLIAAPWSRDVGIDVYARSVADPAWKKTELSPQAGNVRSFAVHVDAVTGVSEVFAGASSNGSDPSSQIDSAQIYTATLDRPSRTLQWNATPETWVGAAPDNGYRVMNFAEANGVLFATVGTYLYERIDGLHPRWKRVYTGTFPPSLNITANGGLRGLHTIAAPDGNGDSLLMAACGPTAHMVRVDPNDNFAATVERGVIKLLSDAYGTSVAGSLVAYNDMVDVPNPATGTTDVVMGLESYVDSGNTDPQPFPMWDGKFFAPAHYIIRHADGTYDVREAEDLSLASPPPRVSVRALTVSPFDPSMFFIGGFDANSQKVHNTAWALTAPISVVLNGGM